MSGMIAFITHHDFRLHDMGALHPECPSRLTAIDDCLVATGLDMVMRFHDAIPATREQLLGAHDESHVDRIFSSAPPQDARDSTLVRIDDDTVMNRHTLRAALLSAGAAAQAVDLVMSDRASQVFCSVRPPGHHATRTRAMGSCFFNNVAVAAYEAIRKHKLKRVAIVDFDVHHGNGTEDIVSGDDRILFCSIYHDNLFAAPEKICEEVSGTDNSSVPSPSSVENIFHTPLPSGCGGSEFREAVKDNLLPQLEAFSPQLIIVSAGFDGHWADDMGDFNLVDEDFSWITRRLCEQADRSASGKLVSCLEGGYGPALGRCVEVHLKAMLGPNEFQCT